MTKDPSQRIKQKATEFGFCSVGIAKAADLEPEGARLREWLRRGYQGTMIWMERAEGKRSHPGAVLEGAQSIISVAYNYFVDLDHPTDRDRGKISRYAWGYDYHDIVEEKLERLQGFILEAFPSARCRRYVDTGPVMDKAWAVRAGIGWLGKHTNVITKGHGSWVFLGEIITDLILAPDAPVGDFCGTCTACIEACPTKAIVQPYVVDSRRCISYLTIEHKGEIAPEYRARLENWVYGCDVCQDVCPWNSFRKQTHDARFFPHQDVVAPKLDALARLTQEEFALTFKSTPVKRVKLAGLKRNVQAVREGASKSDFNNGL
jgi:epoxyqueuosine reductase